jgi:hypothetical protein
MNVRVRMTRDQELRINNHLFSFDDRDAAFLLSRDKG